MSIAIDIRPVLIVIPEGIAIRKGEESNQVDWIMPTNEIGEFYGTVNDLPRRSDIGLDTVIWEGYRGKGEGIPPLGDSFPIPEFRSIPPVRTTFHAAPGCLSCIIDGQPKTFILHPTIPGILEWQMYLVERNNALGVLPPLELQTVSLIDEFEVMLSTQKELSATGLERQKALEHSISLEGQKRQKQNQIDRLLRFFILSDFPRLPKGIPYTPEWFAHRHGRTVANIRYHWGKWDKESKNSGSRLQIWDHVLAEKFDAYLRGKRRESGSS